MIFEKNELQSLIQKRMPYHHANVPFAVLWANKAGCTSVFKWFLWHAGLLEEAQDYGKTQEGLSIHNYENKVFKKTQNYRKNLAARIEAGIPIVNFMRCPFSRVFSSYMHLHNRFYIRMERDGRQQPGLELRYAVLKSTYQFQPPVEYPITFMDYLNWLETQDLTAIEPHHRQQRTPLYDLPNAVHYRLEDFSSAIEILEHRFKLDNSRPDTGQFSSPHHIKKYSMDQKAILKLLERGISLNRSPGYLLPDLTRDMLEGTPYGERIKSIFQDDIAFYEGIEPHDNHIPVASGAFPGKTR